MSRPVTVPSRLAVILMSWIYIGVKSRHQLFRIRQLAKLSVIIVVMSCSGVTTIFLPKTPLTRAAATRTFCSSIPGVTASDVHRAVACPECAVRRQLLKRCSVVAEQLT